MASTIVGSGLLILVLIGAFGGLTGGMFGVGGSVVMIPALTEAFGPNQHGYQAACMIVNFFVAVPAMVQHRHMGAIDRKSVVRLIPPGLAAVLLGVAVSELPVFAEEGEAYLRGLFGLFLLFLSIQESVAAIRGKAGGNEAAGDLAFRKAVNETPVGGSPKTLSWFTAAIIAVPTGFIAGLLGVGGGLIAVPLQHRWMHVPMRVAIANSASVIVATSFVGAVVKNYAYCSEGGGNVQPLFLAATLVPTAMLGSILGSRWTHRLSARLVKLLFFALLLFAALRLIHGAARSLGI